jgi:uncharacterized membrane protein YdcZ (DUF606 family)
VRTSGASLTHDDPRGSLRDNQSHGSMLQRSVSNPFNSEVLSFRKGFVVFVSYVVAYL